LGTIFRVTFTVFYRRIWNIVGKYSIMCCDTTFLHSPGLDPAGIDSDYEYIESKGSNSDEGGGVDSGICD
jgi:hypothetical protein